MDQGRDAKLGGDLFGPDVHAAQGRATRHHLGGLPHDDLGAEDGASELLGLLSKFVRCVSDDAQFHISGGGGSRTHLVGI